VTVIGLPVFAQKSGLRERFSCPGERNDNYGCGFVSLKIGGHRDYLPETMRDSAIARTWHKFWILIESEQNSFLAMKINL
jgi:hypothetical protein